jgi:adenine-specific DNA-methyltransferase
VDHVGDTTADLASANIEALGGLFPEVVTEALGIDGEVIRAIDFDALRQIVADRVVEGSRERHQLDWPGKRQAMLAANAPTRSTLRPRRDESVNFETTKNLFIEGDNLEALKIIQESYLGRVDLIYIDPPYNTGNDFIYRDDFAESNTQYLVRSGQNTQAGERLVANTEAAGRFHSVWLSMMYPRLSLARRLLSDDGVIIVAIDDHEHGHLRLLLDQVFGSANFIANITWQGSGKNDARYTAGGVDYMLIYAKNEKSLRERDTRWREPKPGIEAVERIARLAWEESGGDATRATAKFRRELREIQGDLDPAVYRYDQIDTSGRIYQSTDLRSPNPRPNLQYAIAHPTTGLPVKMHPNGWVYSSERMQELVNEGRVIFGPDETTAPRLKRFLDEQGERVPYAAFTQVRMPSSKKLGELLGEVIFDYPKDTSVLGRWIGAITRDKKDAIILDFFAGSASTGHAVMEVNVADGGNRRFILIQLGEVIDHPTYSSIADIARERLRRAGRKLAEESGLLGDQIDVGFRSLHIASPNMEDNRATADSLSQATLLDSVRSVKQDRSDDDLIFQVLLDGGLDLAESISVEHVEGNRITSVSDGAIIGYFVDDLPEAAVKGVAARRPMRAVFLDSSFKTDADRINLEQTFRELSPETEVKVI